MGLSEGIYRWETNPPGANWINYSKVRKGMKYQEVIALLGKPYANIPQHPGTFADFTNPGHTVEIMVATDANDRVILKLYLARDGVVDQVLTWLSSHGW